MMLILLSSYVKTHIQGFLPALTSMLTDHEKPGPVLMICFSNTKIRQRRELEADGLIHREVYPVVPCC